MCKILTSNLIPVELLSIFDKFSNSILIEKMLFYFVLLIFIFFYFLSKTFLIIKNDLNLEKF